MNPTRFAAPPELEFAIIAGRARIRFTQIHHPNSSTFLPLLSSAQTAPVQDPENSSAAPFPRSGRRGGVEAAGDGLRLNPPR